MIKNISMICYSLAIAFALDADAMRNHMQFSSDFHMRTNTSNRDVSRMTGATLQLITAFQNNDVPQILFCIQHGADVNIEICDKTSALMMAALKGYEDVAASILQSKRNININRVNRFQNTALMLAASKGHVGIIDLLVQAGAKIEIEGANGNTALINAAINGHAGAVNRLLLHGANINKGNMAGYTALIAAASRGYLDVVGVILWLDATCINIKNKNGDTALILAVINCHEKVVERLLRYRAKTNIKNDREETAYGIAIRGGNAKIIACFQ